MWDSYRALGQNHFPGNANIFVFGKGEGALRRAKAKTCWSLDNHCGPTEGPCGRGLRRLLLRLPRGSLGWGTQRDPCCSRNPGVPSGQRSPMLSGGEESPISPGRGRGDTPTRCAQPAHSPGSPHGVLAPARASRLPQIPALPLQHCVALEKGLALSEL